jgi:hypothetical protein
LNIQVNPQTESQRTTVMPTLVWIAFWSSIMGAATCWQQSAQPVAVKKADRRDHPAV